MIGGDDEAERRPDGRTWAAVAVGLLLLVAWLMGHGGSGGTAGAATPAHQALAAAVNDHPPQLYAPHPPLPAARPLRLDIASLGLHADIIGRGLRDGTVDPPPYATPDVAGWYRDGPAPGTPGAALIVGHVDTTTGPAVFYLLSDLQPGALIDITRTDGTTAEFTVEATETIPKSHFDPTRVYGSTARPELHLITCGGPFDQTTRTYTANVVVYAALTGSRRT